MQSQKLLNKRVEITLNCKRFANNTRQIFQMKKKNYRKSEGKATLNQKQEHAPEWMTSKECDCMSYTFLSIFFFWCLFLFHFVRTQKCLWCVREMEEKQMLKSHKSVPKPNDNRSRSSSVMRKVHALIKRDLCVFFFFFQYVLFPYHLSRSHSICAGRYVR